TRCATIAGALLRGSRALALLLGSARGARGLVASAALLLSVLFPARILSIIALRLSALSHDVPPADTGSVGRPGAVRLEPSCRRSSKFDTSMRKRPTGRVHPRESCEGFRSDRLSDVKLAIVQSLPVAMWRIISVDFHAFRP